MIQNPSKMTLFLLTRHRSAIFCLAICRFFELGTQEDVLACCFTISSGLGVGWARGLVGRVEKVYPPLWPWLPWQSCRLHGLSGYCKNKSLTKWYSETEVFWLTCYINYQRCPLCWWKVIVWIDFQCRVGLKPGFNNPTQPPLTFCSLTDILPSTQHASLHQFIACLWFQLPTYHNYHIIVVVCLTGP